MLIQVGSEDDYDNGVENCQQLARDIAPESVWVIPYEGAFHAWDRLQVPTTILDPFANEGSIFMTGKVPEVDLVPDVDLARASRRATVRFFLRRL